MLIKLEGKGGIDQAMEEAASILELVVVGKVVEDEDILMAVKLAEAARDKGTVGGLIQGIIRLKNGKV
jgi:hypothetical protein